MKREDFVFGLMWVDTEFVFGKVNLFSMKNHGVFDTHAFSWGGGKMESIIEVKE